jgi:hypothetical protein
MSDETNIPEEAEGTIHAEDLVPSEPVPLEEPTDSKKSIVDVAKEALAGKWGKGLVRNERLKNAGYDPSEVNVEISKIFNR